MIASREVKGKEIAEAPNQVKRLSDYSYHVRSQTGEGFYRVVNKKFKWSCECPDHEYRALDCKHIWAVRFSLALRKEVQAAQVQVIEPIAEIEACIFCNSPQIVRDGLRRNRHGNIQKWNCKACGRYFTVNLGFERMKHTPQVVTTAMQLYFGGQSLRTTSKSLRLLGVNVTHKTVFMWIKKYTALMEKYLDKITPQVSDTWRADEMFLTIKGNMKYLYALMDDDTRFWIAKEVANTKFTADVQPLFQKGQQLAGKKPQTLITDGARNFHEAYLKEFYTMDKTKRTEHIQEIRMAGKVHNNKMERFNGQIRDREKVMRTLEIPDSPILAGYQIFHN